MPLVLSQFQCLIHGTYYVLQNNFKVHFSGTANCSADSSEKPHAVSPPLCQHEDKVQTLTIFDQSEAITCCSNVLQNPNIPACQRIMHFCPKFDIDEAEIRKILGDKNLGADSVGGNCE